MEGEVIMDDNIYQWECSRCGLHYDQRIVKGLTPTILTCKCGHAHVYRGNPDLHVPGAKDDADKPRMGLVLLGFAGALEEVAKVGTIGAKKYTDHGWCDVPNGVERYTDAMLRHLIAETKGDTDDETGMLHAAQVAWNALARLELLLGRSKK